MLEAISQQKQDPEIAISVVTVLELAHGIARADAPQSRARRQRFLDDLLAGMAVHPLTVAIALRAGQADGVMQLAGKLMALDDLLIGSTCTGPRLFGGHFQRPALCDASRPGG